MSTRSVTPSMPKGKVDFGWNIAMGGIPLFLTTGPGFGEAEVYHMLNIAYGSLKLTKHLPGFEGFQVDRIIVYPLLLHSLKNYSTMKWESPPTNISAAKKKETALKALLRRLQQDQFLGHGGYRVEARLSGHGDPKECLHQFMAWVNHRKSFEAKVQMKVISLDEYLATATNAVNKWGSMLNRDSRLELSTGHPIVDGYRKALNALGFSLEPKPFQILIDLVGGSHGDGPAEARTPDAPAAPEPAGPADEAPDAPAAPEPAGPAGEPVKLEPQAGESNMYDLALLPGVPPGTALRPLPDPDCEDGHIPYESWDTSLKVVYQRYPKRITYQKVGGKYTHSSKSPT